MKRVAPIVTAGSAAPDPAGERARLLDEIESLRAERDRARHEAAAAAREAGAFRAALDRMPVGVVLADREGRIVHGNAELARMVGHPVVRSPSAEDYSGWAGYHADGRRIATEEYPLAKILRDGAESAELDVHYERPGGERIWLHLDGRVIRSAGGAREGAVVAVMVIDAVKQGEAEKALLLAELDHRVKNVFATMIALIGRSLRGSDELEAAGARLQERIHAYAESHAALTQADWAGSTVGDVALVILGGHITSGRVEVEGPTLPLSAKAALSLSMAFHELATNATKYGALSRQEGRVDLRWESREGTRGGYRIRWQERGGPPVAPPQRRGFGSFIIERAVALETGGAVAVDLEPSGLRWTLEV